MRETIQSKSEESVEIRATSNITISPYSSVVCYGKVDDKHSSIKTSLICLNPSKTMIPGVTIETSITPAQESNKFPILNETKSTISIPRKTLFGTLTPNVNIIASVTELTTGTSTDGKMS